MCKIKTWVIDEKKAVRFYHDWNDKEVGYKYYPINYLLILQPVTVFFQFFFKEFTSTVHWMLNLLPTLFVSVIYTLNFSSVAFSEMPRGK